MSIHHHPTDATLLAYAAGSLNESLSVLVATHVAMCPECRAKVEEYEALGGDILDRMAPVSVDNDALNLLLDRLIQGPPLWFNEGLAEYYEAAELVRGELETGQLVHRHFDTLEKTGLTPLPTLFALEPGKFMANATRHYAQSWAFVHFLRHTPPERARLFRRFWDAFRRFPSHRKATLHALRGQSMSALDREFRAWLREQ